jgi:hypothetical protein
MKFNFIEECKAIVVESTFSSNWAIIEGWWELGKRIVEEKDFTLKDIKRLAYEIDREESEILMAILFYKKYPDLSMLPGGKNITWYSIQKNNL